jgi:dihydrolipoamide dehydrogenase
VNEHYGTNIEGIYAIGDVNAHLMLAHAASHQGIVAADRATGHADHPPIDNVPNCIFIFPEIATVGISEDQAKEKGISYKTSRFMFGANGKALALGEPEGMVKVIADAQERIIGVHIMGPHASDLIHEGVIAVNAKLDVNAISEMVHAHPTLAEAFSEAVMGINGTAIHMLGTKK